MTEYVTYADLERINNNIPDPSQVVNASRSDTGKTIFLSHSSKDNKYLPAVIRIIENHGGKVYIDAKDERLPETPSVETAQILRKSLHSCRKLVLFVTPNSKDSKWIPWELGLADGAKTQYNVAILPAAQYTWEKNWAEQEYIGLYDRIVWGNFANQNKEWLVHNHRDNTADRLQNWLNR